MKECLLVTRRRFTCFRQLPFYLRLLDSNKPLVSFRQRAVRADSGTWSANAESYGKQENPSERRLTKVVEDDVQSVTGHDHQLYKVYFGVARTNRKSFVKLTIADFLSTPSIVISQPSVVGIASRTLAFELKFDEDCS